MKPDVFVLCRRVSAPLFSIIATLCVAPANAAQFFTNADLILERLDFKVQSSNGSTDYTLSPVFTMVSLTGSMVVADYYVSANWKHSLLDSELDNVVLAGDHDSLSRSDGSITVGCYIQDYISVFVGYLTGDTKDNYSSPGAKNETGSFSFSEKGLFLGTNTIIPISRGALSLNFAYAFLEGEYNANYNNDSGQGAQRKTGDTSGVSLGAKFVEKLTPQINYVLGIKVNLFKFKSNSFTTEENFYIAQAGISYKM